MSGSWDKERKKLKKIYEAKDITRCENCGTDQFLSFAHRYKKNDPRCEDTFVGTLLLCVPCHHEYDFGEKMGELDELFKKLRGV